MKNRRIFLSLILALLCGQAALAQKKGTAEYEARLAATMVALDTIIKYHSLNEPVEAFADSKCKEFKGDSRLPIHAAESFALFNGSKDVCFKRFESIIKTFSKEPTGYCCFADMLAVYGDTTRAKHILDSCKQMVPKSPEPYLAWARLRARYNEAEADQEIEALRSKIPTANACVEAAEIYWLAMNKKPSLFSKVAEWYEKADDSTLKSVNYLHYLMSYYLGKDYANSLKVSLQAQQQFPDNAAISRMVLWNQAMLNMNEDALVSAERFFAISDTIKYSYEDYYYYANALRNNINYSKAVDVYREAIPLLYKDDLGEKYYAIRSIINDSIVNCYYNMKRLDLVVKEQKEYMAWVESEGRKVSPNDYNVLAQYYMKMGNDSVKEPYRQADSVYHKMLEAYPEHASFTCEKILIGIQLYYSDRLLGDRSKFMEDEIRDDAIALLNASMANWEDPELTQKNRKIEAERIAKAYYFIMFHYYYLALYKEASEWAEKLLDFPDIPEKYLNETSIMQIYNLGQTGKKKRR